MTMTEQPTLEQEICAKHRNRGYGPAAEERAERLVERHRRAPCGSCDLGYEYVVWACTAERLVHLHLGHRRTGRGE